MSGNVKFDIMLADDRVMHAELLPEYAPISVANFLELIESKFFDGLCFHRVIPGFVIQGGGMTYNKDAKGLFGKKLVEKNWPKQIKGEFNFNGVKNTLKHTVGVLSMARTTVMNSATSQFFICVDTAASLDNNYAGFGRLIDQDSIQVAIDISKVPTTKVGPHDDVPIDPIIIKTVELIKE